MDEKEYSYVAAYFILFLLPRGRVVHRPSRDADNERFRSAREGSGYEIDRRVSTSIQDTGLGLGLRL